MCHERYFSSRPLLMISNTSCMTTFDALPCRSSAVMGLCIVNVTVPRLTDFALRLNTSKLPLMVRGTIGSPISLASMNDPRLNVPILPVRVRVPSGNMIIDIPPRSVSLACATALAMPEMPSARYMCYALTHA